MKLIDRYRRWRGKKLRSGQKCPLSGVYRLSSGEYEATIVRGEPMPPTPQKGQYWVIVDATNVDETQA